MIYIIFYYYEDQVTVAQYFEMNFPKVQILHFPVLRLSS